MEDPVQTQTLVLLVPVVKAGEEIHVKKVGPTYSQFMHIHKEECSPFSSLYKFFPFFELIFFPYMLIFAEVTFNYAFYTNKILKYI